MAELADLDAWASGSAEPSASGVVALCAPARDSSLMDVAVSPWLGGAIVAADAQPSFGPWPCATYAQCWQQCVVACAQTLSMVPAGGYVNAMIYNFNSIYGDKVGTIHSLWRVVVIYVVTRRCNN